MKKALSLFLALVLCLGLCACGRTQSDTQNTYMTIDGSRYDIDYLFTLNDLQREDYSEKKVSLVAELTEVGGSTRFSSFGDVDSYLSFEIAGISQRIIVETSGAENIIKNWNPGDLVEVSGQISFLTSSTIYFFQFYPKNNNITFKKV